MADRVKALTFDTGGTVLNWYAGIKAALEEIGAKRGLERDWAAITTDYRLRALNRMGSQGAEGPPAFNLDDVHREVLAEICAEQGLEAFTAEDREAIWAAWHGLRCWPDFPEGFARLKRDYICAAFTILPVRLIVDTARVNGLAWDAVLSCETMGVYKVLPESYRIAAKWLQLDPGDCMMVACHNSDLGAARSVGFKTAYVRRPGEWGDKGPAPKEPDPGCDIVVDSFPALAERLGS